MSLFLLCSIVRGGPENFWPLGPFQAQPSPEPVELNREGERAPANRPATARGGRRGKTMEKALRVYGEVLRLVRRLPKDTRPYYAKYARENFVNYRDVDAGDPKALDELFHRAYNHSIWVLNKACAALPFTFSYAFTLLSLLWVA